MPVILSDDELWSAVIKYGKNQSTYKMALEDLKICYRICEKEKENHETCLTIKEKRYDNLKRKKKTRRKDEYFITTKFLI